MKTRVILTLILAVASFLAVLAPVAAQEAIEAGTVYEGEITDENWSAIYTYEGTGGEIIAIELFPVDILADYDNPSITILDSADTELATLDGFGETTLVYQIPEDGTYTIIASRRDGEAGTSVGEYTLLLTSAEVLEVGQTISGSIDERGARFYVYEGDADFSIAFNRSGTLPVSVTIANPPDRTVYLDELATVAGVFDQVSLGSYVGGNTYVIVIDEVISFSMEPLSAEYELAVNAAE